MICVVTNLDRLGIAMADEAVLFFDLHKDCIVKEQLKTQYFKLPESTIDFYNVFVWYCFYLFLNRNVKKENQMKSQN